MTTTTKFHPLPLDQSFTHTTATHTLTIKYTTLGSPSSPPLIFIHGTPWSHSLWTPYARALSQKYHVHLFDNPGFGASPSEQLLPNTPFAPASKVEALDADLTRQTAAFTALFQHWEAEQQWSEKRTPPHVIAHDHGGLMALRALLLHGCRFKSLCLIDVVALGPFGQSLFDSIAAAPEHFRSLPHMAFEGILEAYIRHAACGELDAATVAELKRPWVERSDGREGFVRQMCQAAVRETGEVEGRYGEVREMGVPVMVVWGREDRWIGVETAERLGAVLGARRVVVVEGAGHLVVCERGEEVGVLIGGWVAECDAGGKD